MTEEEAYAEAERRISEVEKEIDSWRGSAFAHLSLSGLPNLTSIPSTVSKLKRLKSISLEHTSVQDISILAHCRNLESLSISHTSIANIDVLESLSDLCALGISHSMVSDLTPIKNSATLRNLTASGTKIKNLEALERHQELDLLIFDNTPIEEISILKHIPNISILRLDNTLISDLDAISKQQRLMTLRFENTQVANLDPLEEVLSLRYLWLQNTRVEDLSPLSDHTELETVRLQNSNVSDLRPLLKIEKLWETNQHKGESKRPVGLEFHSTAATLADPELAQLASLQDASERSVKTRAYLSRLPPWPEPLFSRDPIVDAEPVHELAPIKTAWINDTLVAAPTSSGLSDQIELRARQGWAALVDYLSDFVTQRARIVNQLPALAKAFNALERALGDDYDTINPVQLGMQAERLIRLSKRADDMLLMDDAEDVTEFTLQLARYLPRFPAWQSYMEDSADEDAVRVQKALTDFRALHEGLQQESVVAPEVPLIFGDVLDAVEVLPEDQLMALGGRRISIEVSLTLAEKAKEEADAAKEKGVLSEFRKAVHEERIKAYARDAVRVERALVYGSSIGVASAVLLNHAEVITAIAAKFPEEYTYVMQVLRYLGWTP